MITTQYRDEVYARTLAHNTPSGRCMTAMRQVFETALAAGYPDGTNIVVEFIKLMLGLPYGDNGLSLDYKADCSQFVINVLHYFFGVSNLGSYTQSLYNATGGTKYYDWKVNPPFSMDYLNNAPNLSIILYKFSDRNTDATHASMKINATQIAHTRSTSKPLMLDKLTYSTSSITQIRDMLTPEQHLMVLVGDVDYNNPAGPKKNTEEFITVDDLKYPVKRLRYNGSTFTNFRNYPATGRQYDIGNINKGDEVIVLNNNIGMGWMLVLFNGVIGFCASRQHFIEV